MKELKARLVRLGEDAIMWGDKKKPQNWAVNLEKYLKELELADRKDNTVKNYRSWLTPWVEFIKKSGLDPSTALLREYKDRGNMGMEASTINRKGKQIVVFTNSFQDHVYD